MKRVARLVLVVTPVLVAWSAGAQSSPPASHPRSGGLGEHIQDGDDHYDRRPDLDELRRAISSYSNALALAPDSYDANWRLARAQWFLGEISPRDQRKAIFKTGMDHAARARALNAGAEDGHYWYAVCLARYSEERGILNSLFAVADLQGALLKTIEINPTHCWVHHVLGVLYRKAPGWPVSRGDLNKSLEHARIAVRECPEAPLPHVGLAETLIALDREEEARQALRDALSAPGAPDLKPESARDRKTARALLEQLKP